MRGAGPAHRRARTGDELDRLADTLNGMLARLENTFTEMRRFSADAAHELRSPLTALKARWKSRCEPTAPVKSIGPRWSRRWKKSSG